MLLQENNFMKRAIIKLPNWGSGFFSNYFCVISMLYEVEELGYEPYVDFTNTAFVEDYNPYFDESPPINTENPWDWWFYQKPLEIDSEHIFIQYSNNRFNVNKKIWESSELSKARYLKDKYTILRKPILDSVSSFFNKNFANRVVLGVMARGTEMNRIHPEYGNQTVQDYIKKTKAVLKKHKEIDCIYLVTEDSATISAFQKEFPYLIYNKDVFRRTNEPLDYTISYPLWPCLDKSRENHCKILGEEMLLQALLLAKCDYLIAKVCGTASAAIFFSEKIKKVFYVETIQLFNPYLTLKQKIKIIIKKLFSKINIKYHEYY